MYTKCRFVHIIANLNCVSNSFFCIFCIESMATFGGTELADHSDLDQEQLTGVDTEVVISESDYDQEGKKMKLQECNWYELSGAILS